MWAARRIIYSAESAEELRAAFEILHRYEMPVLVIGNGSNLLVRDKGIRGA